MSQWALALRLARRELRAGLGGFRIFLACLALGVGAIAAIASFSEAVRQGVRADARLLLGGDVELTLTHRPATAEQRAFLDREARVSEVADMRAMARPVSGSGDAALVQLKAVDGLYPLYGALRLEPDLPLDQVLAAREGVFGAAVEEVLLRRLNARLGDRVKVGETEFELRAVIAREPDRGLSVFGLGPRLMISAEALPATALIQPGTLVSYDYRIGLPAGADADRWVAALKQRFPDAGWRIRGLADAGAGLRSWIERLTLYLGLIGLAALLVGGVGIGNAVDSYLQGRSCSIAILKCVGAPSGLVFRIYLVQIALLALIGIVAGLLAGAVLPYVAAAALGDLLPVTARVGLYGAPLLQAGAFGLLVALLFALWPLARARGVAAAALMRGAAGIERPLPRRRDIAGIALVAALLGALAIATAPQAMVALWFVLGALGAFIAFPLLARGVMAVARAVEHPRHPTLRLALANLHRPGAATVTVMLSLGLGLTVLVATALIEGNLQRQISQRIPADAPSLFFIDIQPDQVEAFDRTVLDITGGGLSQVPSLRGRIVRINGTPVDQVQVAPEARWAVDSDRGLTYAARQPEGSRVVAGEWWPADYAGPPLVSFDANLAKGFGVGIGDTITVNVLGRDVEARIANLRLIDWSTLNINFTFVFAPGALERAPQTFIATVKTDAAGEEEVFRAVTARFANVTVVRVREALEVAGEILGNIGLAARIVGAVSIGAGLLVLAGAMAATQRRRVYDTVVMKVLGATRRRVVETFAWEFAALGLVTALAACLVGTLAAWLVVVEVMNLSWTFLPEVAGATALGSVVLTLFFGLAGTLGALRQRPLALLRNE